jgi:hypothetical protein
VAGNNIKELEHSPILFWNVLEKEIPDFQASVSGDWLISHSTVWIPSAYAFQHEPELRNIKFGNGNVNLG